MAGEAKSQRVAFIGLGVMGYPMAGHLANAGYPTRVYNRTSARAEAWTREFTGEVCKTPALAARDADVVLMCVGNDHDVRSVAFGDDGALAGLKASAILVDHTTASAELAKELERAAIDRGAGFLDAPVSGGQAGAQRGQLTIMVGGDEKTFARAEPVLSTYARAVRLMGEAGSGQLTKMVN